MTTPTDPSADQKSPAEATEDRGSELGGAPGSAHLFFDPAEHGTGPVRAHYSDRWRLLDSMGDCAADCGQDENTARLLAALLNRERDWIHEPNGASEPRGKEAPPSH